jgi:ankyrin repeat protein
MDVADVTRVMMSYLGDQAIGALMQAGVSYLPSTFQDQTFWHSRVESLSERRVKFDKSVDWNQTYQILKRELAKADPDFWNEEDNATVDRVLLSMRYEPNISALSVAARGGQTNILLFLLGEGSINPSEIAGDEYLPPLTLAADNARPEAVRLLLTDDRVGPNDNRGDTNALSQACLTTMDGKLAEYIEVVRILLEDTRVDPTWAESFCLIAASELGDNNEILQLLLADGRADPNADYGEPFIRACAEGRAKMVALFLNDPRMVPWSKEGEALISAARNGQANVVKLLLEDGRIDPNSQEAEALIEAVMEKERDVVRLLLADDRTHAAYDDNLALMIAIRRGDKEIIKLLLNDDEVIAELTDEQHRSLTGIEL